MPANAARFAASYAVLTAAHEVGDYLIQKDHDATTKGHPGTAGAAACLRHVASYTLTQAAALAAANYFLGLRIHPGRAASGLALSAVTHYVADRCNGHWADSSDTAPTLVRFAHKHGKTQWLTRDPGTGPLIDQAWHKGWIALAAALTATGPGRS